MEILNIDLNRSILSSLDDSDLREIYCDQILKLNGYKFTYIVDADDIAMYSHPFQKKNDRDLGEVSDEQFVIEYLFNNGKNKVVILEDYFEELIRTRQYLSGAINVSKLQALIRDYDNSLESLIDNLGSKEISKKDHEFLRQVLMYYSFLQSYASGNFKNKLSKLNNLLASDSILFEGSPKNNNNTQFLRKHLSAYKYDRTLTKFLFDQFQFPNKSKLNDINAILKTYHLTKSVLKKRHKHVYFFLSSDTEDIQTLRSKILNKTYDHEQFRIENFYFTSYSLIRSKKQIFASIIYESFPRDTNKAFLSFPGFKEELKGIIKKLDSKKGKSTLNKNFQESIVQNKELIENIAILQNTKNRKLSQKNNQEDQELLETQNFLGKENDQRHLQKRSEEKIRSFLLHVDRIVGQEFKRTNLKDWLRNTQFYLRLSVFEIEVLKDFLRGIESKKDNLYYVDRGDDPIESIFAAFPHLSEFDFYRDSLHKLLSDCNNNLTIRKTKLREFLDSLEMTDELNHQVLAFVLYLLLLVKYKDPKRQYSSNFFVFKRAKKIIQTYSNLDYDKSNNTKSSTILFKEGEKKLADFYAIAAWAARRSRKYLFAYEYAQKGKSIFPSDPRFDFSLALTGYSWRYEFYTEGRYEWDCEDYFPENSSPTKSSILDHCENAIFKFEALLNKNNHYFIENYLALLNHTSFCYSAKFKSIYEEACVMSETELRNTLSQKEVQNLLINSRNTLVKLKNTFMSNPTIQKQAVFANYPEYVHTEVFLELYEICNTQVIKKIINQDKLEHALRDINYAIKSCDKTNRQGLKLRCQKLLERLQGL